MPKSHKATRGKAGRRARLRKAATRKRIQAEKNALIEAYQKHQNEMAKAEASMLNTSTNSNENELLLEIARTKARKQVHGSPSRSPRSYRSRRR